MKIYFEDGRLEYNPMQYGVPEGFREIDAKDGYAANMYDLMELKTIDDNEVDIVLYTNSLAALSNLFCWNDKLNVPELYLRAEIVSSIAEANQFTDRILESYVRVDKLTDKEIHKAHNLMQMYMNGAFAKKIILEVGL